MDFLAEHAGMIGLITFFTAFVGIVLWTFRPGSKEQHDKHARIPLEEHHGGK